MNEVGQSPLNASQLPEQPTAEREQTEEAPRRRDGELKVTDAADAERQRFLSVLETLPAMVCLLTKHHHVAFANRSFRERFGEAQGRRCHENCLNVTEMCGCCERYSVMATGQPRHWEVTCSDGTVIETYDVPFTDVDGSPLM